MVLKRTQRDDEDCIEPRKTLTVEAEALRTAAGTLCGTAAVVAPIGSVRHAGGEFAIANGTVGPVTRKLRDTLVGIQRGTQADVYGWLHKIE